MLAIDPRYRAPSIVALLLLASVVGCGRSNPVDGETSALPVTATSSSESPTKPSITTESVPIFVEHNVDPPEIQATTAPSEPNAITESHQEEPNTPSELIAQAAATSDDAPTADGIFAESAAESTGAESATSDWLQFRGSTGQGHSEGRGYPREWSEKKNIAWKVPIKGLGWSSPVIAHDRIWLTTCITGQKSLRLLCIDAKTGQTVNDIEVFRVQNLGGIHSKNSHATPTPVLVDDRCYVHFGSHGTAALNLNGDILWKTKIEYFHHHGPASSPVIVDGSMIFNCDGGTFSFYDDRKIPNLVDAQFAIALDTMTGDVRWKSARDGAHSYSTPLLIDVDGKAQLISAGGNRVYAYDPQNGEEIWSCGYEGYSVVPRPVYGHGLVFVCTGYDSPKLLAIRPDGHGDVTDTHVAWKSTKVVPLDPSPILVGDELYTVSNQGVITCYEAKTGKIHWRQRVGGNHSASPVYADGRLFCLDEGGTTHILECGLKPKVLAKNALPGKTLASLAICGRVIFLRNEKFLYRIEEPESKAD